MKTSKDNFLTYISSTWEKFGKSVLRPDFILLLLLSCLFVGGNVLVDKYITNNQTIRTLLLVIFTVLTGIFAANLANIYNKYSIDEEDNIIKQKGKTSIRTLTSVLSKLDRIRENIRFFKSKDTNKSDSLQMEFKDIWDIVDLLRDDVKNAVRDWSDILPDIETILDIKDQQFEILQDIEELKTNRKELGQTNEKQKKELEVTQNDINAKKAELERLNSKLNNYNSTYQPLVSASPTTVSGASSINARFNPYTEEMKGLGGEYLRRINTLDALKNKYDPAKK